MVKKEEFLTGFSRIREMVYRFSFFVKRGMKEGQGSRSGVDFERNDQEISIVS